MVSQAELPNWGRADNFLNLLMNYEFAIDRFKGTHHSHDSPILPREALH